MDTISSYISNIYLLAIWMAGCLFFYILLSPNRKDILSPYYIVTLLYSIIFLFGPMYYLKLGKTTVEGIEVMQYLPKASFVFGIGFFSYTIGSIVGVNSKSARRSHYSGDESVEIDCYTNADYSYIIKYAWIIYGVGMTLGMLYYITTGRNLLMMLTFGQMGNADSVLTGTNYAFLVYFMDFPISALMLLFTYSKGIKVWVATIVYALVTISAGFRYLPMCFALAAVCCYFLRKKKRPKIITVLAAIAIAYVFIGVVGVYRGSMKTGGVIDLSQLNTESILNSFLYNSDVFYPFYCLVNAMQSGSVLCHSGQGVLYIFIMAIPRFLWPNKPTSFGLTAFEAMWGNSMGGAAYPNIGEFYYEFGYAGMILCMFLFGYWIEKKFIRCLRSSDSNIKIISYSLFYGYLLQFINRGYITGWAFDIVFFLFPIWLLKYLLQKRKVA